MIAGRTAAPEVGGDGPADIGGQRQAVHPAALAHHDQLAGPPIDVLQPQARHLCPAQAEAQEGDDQRVVAPTDRRATVAGCEQRVGIVLGDPPGQPRTPPAGYRQRRLRQVDRDDSLDEAQTQEGPHAGHEVLRRAHRHRRRLPQHGGRHLRRRHLREPTGRQSGHQPSRTVHVATHGARRQATLEQQVVPEGVHERVGRRWRRPDQWPHDAQLAQQLEQARQTRPRQRGPLATAGALDAQEGLDARFAQLLDTQALRLEPTAHLRHLPLEVDGGQPRIAALLQLLAVRVSERAQRTCHQHPAHPAGRPRHACLLLSERGKRRWPPQLALCRPLRGDRLGPQGLRHRDRDNAEVGIIVEPRLGRPARSGSGWRSRVAGSWRGSSADRLAWSSSVPAVRRAAW